MENFLNNILRGLVDYGVGIFVVLILGFLVYTRRFLIALKEWQRSVFGLERSMAQRQLVTSTTGLALLLFLIIGEFLIVTIVGPRMPSIQVSATEAPENPFATLTVSVEPEEATLVPTATVGQDTLVSDCIPEVVEITFPADGDTISGTVEIIGSMNPENFGSYKYEFSPTGAISWTTIAAGNQLKLDELLGYWYTNSLTPGVYLLQLVPLDNEGNDMTPCIITVEVVSEE
ncbi:hypothetical protein JR338_02070 [Chloroflexota bacterium]|nr:hypothetical protein JR338_02070 [Chloroflexota bacterium]